MADEENLYLDNLDEFINDQDKVVTYKWLSRSLSVASNTAKQMLYAFLIKEREKKSNSLTATYLVGGRFEVDDQLVQQYVLTSDDKLEETKNQFECVTSVHVYSLQKKTPKDINTLYTVDYEIHQEHKDEPNKWSHIYFKEGKKLSDGGANRGTSKAKPGKENAIPKSEMTNGLGPSSSMADKSKPKPSNQRPKKGQLPNMGMFAVKTEKKPEQPKPDEPASNTDSHKNAKPAKPVEKSKPSAMMSFFGKQISEPAKSKPEPKKETKEKVVEKEKEKVKEKSEEKTPVDTKDIKETKENKQKSNKPTKQSRKRIKNLLSSDEEEEDPVPKSLKKLVSDSESEEEIKPRRSKPKNKKEKEVEVKKTTKKEKTNKDEKATQDEEKDKKNKTKRKRKKEEKEESSEEDSINSKSNATVISETLPPNQRPAENSTKRRKRQKVLKSKTYVDDDGFMVTEKVYESESTDASDEEEEVIEAKQDPLPAPLNSKNTSPDSKSKKQMDLKPVKQASLMSFFKKN